MYLNLRRRPAKKKPAEAPKAEAKPKRPRGRPRKAK